MLEKQAAKGRKKVGFSQQNTKRNNTMLLLNLIRKNDPVSRIMLTEMTGLSATTVSLLVEELISGGLVTEIGTADSNVRGRKPILLRINPSGGYVIVIDVINTGLNVHLFDLNCERVDVRKFRTGRDSMQNAASELVAGLLRDHGIDPKKLLGINIDYPGITDRQNRRMVYSVVVSPGDYFCDDDIHELAVRYPWAEVMLTNSSTVGAYANFIFSDYKFTKTMLFVNMYEAVGAGAIVVNEHGDRIYDFPVELGHVMVDSNGPVCKCGNTGCFELVAGARVLFEHINERTKLKLDYADEFMSEKNVECMKQIGAALAEGDSEVAALVDELAEAAARALNTAINVVDPGYIFFGGLVKYLGDEFITRVTDKLRRTNIFRSSVKRVVQMSDIDYQMRLKGAVNMVLDDVFAITLD